MDASLLFSYNANPKNFDYRMKRNMVKILYTYKVPLTKDTQSYIIRNLHRNHTRKILKFTKKITQYVNHRYEKRVFQCFPSLAQISFNITKLSRFFFARRFIPVEQEMNPPNWKLIPRHISKIAIVYHTEGVSNQEIVKDMLRLLFFRHLRAYEVRFLVNNISTKLQLDVLLSIERRLKYFYQKLESISIDTTNVFSIELVKHWSQTINQLQSLTSLDVYYLLDSSKDCEIRLTSLTKNLSSIHSLERLGLKVKQLEKEKGTPLLLKNVLAIIKSNMGLTYLKIHLDCQYNQDFMVELAKSLKGLKCLTTIELKVETKPDIFEQGLNLLSTQIKQCPVETLKIDISQCVCRDFDRTEYKEFFQNMILSKTLRQFKIIFPSKKWVAFLKANDLNQLKLSSSSNIEELQLFFKFPFDISKACLCLESFEYLKVLELGIDTSNNSKVGLKEAKVLFKTLRKLKELKSLKLMFNWLEQQAHSELLKYIKATRSVSELYLDISPSTQCEYLEKYGEVLSQKANLRRLFLNLHPKVQNVDFVKVMANTIKKNSYLERFKYTVSLYDVGTREILEEDFDIQDISHRSSFKLLPFESNTNWF